MPFLTMALKKKTTTTNLLIIVLSLLFVNSHAIFPFFRPPWLWNPMIDEGNNNDKDTSSSQKFDDSQLEEQNLGAGAGGDVDITGFKGEWKLVSDNSGVSAMHSILLPKINKVLMYDATIWRISKLPYPAGQPCRMINKKTGEKDCYYHSVLYDINTAEIRPLVLNTDTWCSSGGLTVDGTLVSTGGFQGGAKTIRYLRDCDTCDWEEYPTALASLRWYSTQATLADGSFIVVGGRREFNYEYIPGHGKQHQNTKSFIFPFLKETTQMDENNLYPFVYLSTDGNIFVFANNRAVLLNPKSNQIVQNYPVLPGGSRNYPANAASVLLPIKLHPGSKNMKIPAEVIICGGAKPEAYGEAERKQNFMSALKDCGRMRITDPKPVWKIEEMPSERVMGDMVILPTGDVMLLNGAKKGASGWGLAKEPNLTPALYRPKLKKGQRFSELASTNIPRMYHSSSTLLPDGKILVAGSNTNNGYQYNVEFPTELRVEKFSPPYLNPSLAEKRPEIVVVELETELKYEKKFAVTIKSWARRLQTGDVQVTMYAPPFTTHGISMNQRLLVLGLIQVTNEYGGYHNIIAEAPPSGKIAPPGYYLLFVVQQGVPSEGVWVRIT